MWPVLLFIIEKSGYITFSYPCPFKFNGFSYLYRQAYAKSIHDFIPKCYKEQGEIDLAQSVFGYTNKEDALKGRVQFGNVILENPNFASEQCFILGGPKATFYPFYLQEFQNVDLQHIHEVDIPLGLYLPIDEI